MNAPAFHAGTVAVISRPNVGKSTLVNALVGAKVSITSNRPQTTRHRLLGIATFPHGQLLLVDTPGLHREQSRHGGKAMHWAMNRAARRAGRRGRGAAGDRGRALGRRRRAGLRRALREAKVPVVLVVNQVDRLKDKAAAAVPRRGEPKPRFRIGAPGVRAQAQRAGATGRKRAEAAARAAGALRRGRDHRQEPAFPRRELVREQLMRQLGAELPYATTVEIERFEEEPSEKDRRDVSHRRGDLGGTRGARRRS